MSDFPRATFTAPKRVVEVARATMGGIDLDAYGDPVLSPMIGAREFYARSAGHRSIRPSGGKRVLLAMPSGGMPECREHSHRLLAAWQEGAVSEALLWSNRNELLRHLPWLFDQPLMVCIPFYRLAPQYLDDELDILRSAPTNTWGFMVYFPAAADLADARARFLGAAGGLGRVIEAAPSPICWRASYQRLAGRAHEGREEEL